MSMDMERRIAAIETDVAVIRATIENHYSELRADMTEVKSETRQTRDKVERLFTTVLSMKGGPARNGDRAWQLAVMGAGWLFGLIALILQRLLQ